MSDPGGWTGLMSEAEAQERAAVARIRADIESGLVSPAEARWREQVRDNAELVKQRAADQVAARTAPGETHGAVRQEIEGPAEAEPAPGPATRSLVFHEDRTRARSYADLKAEQAAAVAGQQQEEQETDAPEKTGRSPGFQTLTFHEDRHPEHGHSRGL